HLETCEPKEFYDKIQNVRGIGPTSAQQLMLYRERPDAWIASRKKKGQEKGLRRWIALSYDADPNELSDRQFQELTADWNGYEAPAIEFLFVGWVMSEKEKAQEEQ